MRKGRACEWNQIRLTEGDNSNLNQAIFTIYLEVGDNRTMLDLAPLLPGPATSLKLILN